MKKYFALLLALVLVVSMTACTPEAPVETEPLTEALQLLVGSTQGDVYTNESLALQFRYPTLWTRGDRQTLAQESDLETYSSAAIEQHLNEGGDLTILYTKNILGTSVVNISIYQDDLSGYSLEEYADVYAQLVEEGLTEQGMTVTEMTRKTVSITGKDRPAASYKLQQEDVTLYQLLWLDTAQEDYVAVATLTALSPEELEELVSAFDQEA